MHFNQKHGPMCQTMKFNLCQNLDSYQNVPLDQGVELYETSDMCPNRHTQNKTNKDEIIDICAKQKRVQCVNIIFVGYVNVLLCDYQLLFI